MCCANSKVREQKCKLPLHLTEIHMKENIYLFSAFRKYAPQKKVKGYKNQYVAYKTRISKQQLKLKGRAQKWKRKPK